MNLRALGGSWLVNPLAISLWVIVSLPQGGQGKGMEYQENLLEPTVWQPYRKPTQVGGHKCAKVYERTRV